MIKIQNIQGMEEKLSGKVITKEGILIELLYPPSSGQFSKEKELLSYLKDNIRIFCNDFLNDGLIEYFIDVNIDTNTEARSKGGRRIDLLINGRKKKYIIEIKNPKYQAENRYAIGQLLDYGREIKGEKELILITSKLDIHTAKTIQHYKLPIRYVYLDKDRTLEFIGEK